MSARPGKARSAAATLTLENNTIETSRIHDGVPAGAAMKMRMRDAPVEDEAWRPM